MVFKVIIIINNDKLVHGWQSKLWLTFVWCISLPPLIFWCWCVDVFLVCPKKRYKHIAKLFVGFLLLLHLVFWTDGITTTKSSTPRGGGYSKKFYTGRLRPNVQPLTGTLLYTICSEKVLFSYTFYWKKAPLSYTFLRRLMNKSLKFFLRSVIR